MFRGHRTELIRREIACSGEKSKIVRSHHVVQISFLGTDRAVALARASHVRSNLEPDSPAVTASYVGLSRHKAPLVSEPIFLKKKSDFQLMTSFLLEDHRRTL